MEAPKVRLSKVLGDVSMKLERMLPKDRANLRAAFDQVVTETSDKEGRCDGLALFKRLNADGATIVVVTHDEDLATAARRKIHMRDGRIVDGQL